MRKIVTVSMVAAAALAVAACGKTETTNATDANAMVTEMNAGEAMGATDNMMAMNSAETNSMTTTTTNAMDTAGNATNAM